MLTVTHYTSGDQELPDDAELFQVTSTSWLLRHEFVTIRFPTITDLKLSSQAFRLLCLMLLSAESPYLAPETDGEACKSIGIHFADLGHYQDEIMAAGYTRYVKSPTGRTESALHISQEHHG